MEVFDVRLHLLWSDILIFLLVASLCAFIVTVVRNPLARKRWSQVFESRIGSASFLVILFYVLIALTDSVHFQKKLDQAGDSGEVHYAPEVTSLPDLALALCWGETKKHIPPHLRFTLSLKKAWNYRKAVLLVTTHALSMEEVTWTMMPSMGLTSS